MQIKHHDVVACADRVIAEKYESVVRIDSRYRYDAMDLLIEQVLRWIGGWIRTSML